MKRCLVGAALAFVLVILPRFGANATAAAAPKLVVLLVVDQMRADYVEWYGAHWQGGLRRLFDRGAWFKNARYPYLNTVTCPGHATLGTGTYPHRHGMILNTWYDRERKKVIECTDDPGAPLLAYGPLMSKRGDSARNLMAPTLGDEMQAQLRRPSRVVALSLKARSSIDIAGHKPDVALWFEGASWVTSSAFTSVRAPWIEKALGEHPLSAFLEKPWTKLLAEADYKFQDAAYTERPPRPWTVTFPHVMKVGPDVGMFGSGPAADDYLGVLAKEALSGMGLGRGAGTDLLAVSFSMTDLVGHSFGPRSHEVQDVLARLDVTVGALLDALDRQVGTDKYVLALGADHGVALIPEQALADGQDAGRISTGALGAAAAKAITAEIGPGEHVPSVQGNDVYLAPGTHEKLVAKEGAIGRVLAALRAVAGVADAFDRDEIADPTTARDGVRKAAALSYYAGRSGDLLISPKANWIIGDLGTNHGSIHDYDQRVPIIFFGAGIKPGVYEGPASPADVAPTLARIIGVKMPRAEGRALTEALGR